MDNQLRESLLKFLDSFEQVFDKDWDYTKEQLGIYDGDETEEQNANAKQMGNEPIYIISPRGTFLNPKVDDEDLAAANWGHREALLRDYRELKKLLIK